MNIFAKVSPFHAAAVLAVLVLADPGHAQQPETLRDAEAVEHLKAQGQYDSLVEAVNAARDAATDANGGNTPDALGQSAKLLAPDGAADNNFGEGVAVSGDTAIVGAGRAGPIFFQGAAYVFVRNGTAWVLQQKLTAADPAQADYFGSDVSISGETAVIGARYADTAGVENRGAAFVFVRSGSTWTQQAKLLASDGTSFDEFGTSVAISGDTVVVGATGNFHAAGAAYVFVRSGTSWSQQQRLINPGSAQDDYYGMSVGISGDTIVIGAPNNDAGGISDRGSAYVFVRSGNVWSFQQQLIAADGAASALFGRSLGISGETIVIGAFNGGAYVFVRGGTTWTQQQKLLAAGGTVAISGNTVLVGASGDDTGGVMDQGGAYVFTRTGTVWTQMPRLFAADGATNDGFGNVAISGGTVVIGALNHDVAGNLNQGAAYVFHTLSPGWAPEAQTVASDGTAGAEFGSSVSISGDTAIVGAPTDDIGAASAQGSAYVFIRSGTTWMQQQKLLASDGAAGDLFGTSVAISGNTVVVGARFADVGSAVDRGAAYVFVRNGTLWTQQQKLLAAFGAASDRFGSSVAISGDTIVAGAPLDDDVATNTGSAYVFVRSGTSWSQQQHLTASSPLSNDQFGWSVGISYNTIIVGAYLDDVGSAVDQGSAYIFIRSGTTWTQQQQLFGSDSAAGDRFGFHVSISQETAVIGAYLADVSLRADEGAGYVFVRNGTSWSQQTKLVSPDGAAGDHFGSSVAVNGDVVVVGSPDDDVAAITNQGSAHVFERAGTTWTHRRQLFASSGAANDWLGDSVSVFGDKIVAGVPNADVPAANQGAALFFVNAPAFATTAAVSRKTHGAAGTFDIPLPLIGTPAVECRSSGGAHTLVFTFTNDLVSGSATITEGTGTVSGSPAFSGKTMTVNLSGVGDVQRITVSLTGVTDSFGQVLPNIPVSVNMLVGDINASKTVNASDIGSVKSQSGLPVTAANFRADVAVSGSITASDIGLVKSRSGQSVP